MIAAGKSATADGSVMVARTCDAVGERVHQVLAIPRRKHGPSEMLRIRKFEGLEIPQVPETYAHLAVMEVAEGENFHHTNAGINEFQVSAGASSGGYLNDQAAKVTPRMATQYVRSIGDFRMTLVLERCKTAREGIQLISQLTERYGARTDNYVVADPSEAWLYEEYRGDLWAAVRVPDDCFVVEANTWRIGEMNLDDPKDFMASKNLTSFALEHGLYNKKDGQFSPSKAYGTQRDKVRDGNPYPAYDRRRIWRAISLLAPSTKLNPEEPSGVYPLFVKPDRKLTPKDLLGVFTDHYQGTEYDHYASESGQYKSTGPLTTATRNNELRFHLNNRLQYQLAPVWGPERIIGITAAVTTWCAQLRSWMPNPIGGLLWTGLAEGATSGHIPMYVGITKTPTAYSTGIQKEASNGFAATYDPKSAYWKFRVISNLVNLFYTATKDDVIPVWRAWEDKLFAQQPVFEKTALELYQKDPKLAVEYVTNYSCDKATEALDIAEEMIAKLHTIIAHYNTPLPTSSGCFMG